MTATPVAVPGILAHDVFCLYPTPRGYVAALRGLSLEVVAGERVVVHGPNGSGKTTLMRVLSGELSPSAGIVRVAGIDLVGAEDGDRAQLRSRQLGLVDQHHAGTLRPELDVCGNVALQLCVAGWRAGAARARALESLAALGLEHLADRSPSTLSGGEAQRVAVCAALAHGPSLVLADEPTGELDRTAADAVYDLLATATAAVGASLLLVSHDARAARIADRVIRIRDGRLSEEWAPQGSGVPSADFVPDETLVVDDRGWLRLPEVLRHQSGVTSGVHAQVEGARIVLTGRGRHGVAAASAAAAPAPRPQLAMAPRPGRDVSAPPPVELLEVSVSRGGRELLTEFSVVVAPGRLTVVQGPSGSGKTTLLRLMTGLERPDRGVVRLGGTDLDGLDRTALARLRRSHLSVASQSGSLLETLDVGENLELVREARSLAPDPALVDSWIEALGLTPLRHRPVRLLTGGERQRVAVARALAVDPELTVMDEPTSQLDEANAERLVRVLVDAARRGLAVVVATHDPVLIAAADDVVIMG